MESKITYQQYTCPMHPEVISDKPGACPKCGMTLMKTKEKMDDDNIDHEEHDK